MMNHVFDEILEQDEQLIKVLKPDHKRYWQSLAFLAIPIFWPFLIIALVLTLFSAPFLYNKAYKNLYYAYTNKRLIIRSGIIGTHYQSLGYEHMTSANVTVGLFDKKRNTGTLMFSSPSLHDEDSKICFFYVKNPYEVLKEIKENIRG